MRPGRARTIVIAALASLAFVVAPTTVHAKDGLELYGDIAQIAIPVLAGGTSLVKEDYDGTLQFAVGTTVTIGAGEQRVTELKLEKRGS